MSTNLFTPILLGLGLWSPAGLLAAERGSRYLRFESSGFGAAKWYLIAGLVVVVLVAAVPRVLRHLAQVRAKSASRTRKNEGVQSFRDRAGALGFKLSESKALGNIAARISPKKPENLLTTASGREYLRIDLKKRLRRREREIEVLRSILEKLDKTWKEELHERGHVRVDANIPVWIAKKVQHADGGAEKEAEEDIFTNVESLAGTLVDISEGGAAIAADLDVEKGDLIEFWSGDAEVLLSPLVAGVIDVRPGGAGESPVFHLHFLDPNRSELATATAVLQQRTRPTAPR